MTPPRNRPPFSPRLMDPRLATAASHPIRVYLLEILDARPASPRELAEELDEPLNKVSYHVEILRDLDCIELVEQRPRHGSRVIEHIYRATRMPILDQETWEQLDMKEKWGLVAPIMRLASEDINESFAAGVFLDPDDNHISRTPLVVDTEGWEEVKDILGDALGHLFDVRENVAARLRRDESAETMSIKVQMFQFRSPDQEKAE